MKRLLLVNKAYWPHLGGVETVVRQLAEGAAKAGFWVEVLCLGPKDTIEEIHNVRVHRVRSTTHLGSAPLASGFLAKYAVLAKQADVIHFHAPNPAGELALLFGGKGNAQRVVCTYHSDPLRPRWAVFAYRQLLRAFLARCDVIVASSPNYIQSSPVLGPLESRCSIIPLGIDVERFSCPDPSAVEGCEALLDGLGYPRILFVGRLVYYKGVDVLLQAVAHIPDVSVVIVGTGPLKGELIALCEKLGLKNRVRFLGVLPDELYPGIFHCADLFVLPSVERTEAFGLVGIEALAAGLPLVTTELGTGTSYYNQEDQTGLVVPKGDASKMAEAIIEILFFRERWIRYANAAGKQAANFSEEKMLGKYLEIYHERA